MPFSRSFFFAFFFFFASLATGAVPALAADSASASQPPLLSSGTQAAATRGPDGQQFLARPGLLFNDTRAGRGRPLAAGPARLLPGTAAGNDGVCYTMRMYKVKPIERLAAGETARRGYSTCELAENYQVRSAAARGKTAGK